MRVHFQTGCEYVEVIDDEKFHLSKEGVTMGSTGFIVYESDYLLLHSNKWLDIGFCRVVRAPYCDGFDEVGICVGVVVEV